MNNIKKAPYFRRLYFYMVCSLRVSVDIAPITEPVVIAIKSPL